MRSSWLIGAVFLLTAFSSEAKDLSQSSESAQALVIVAADLPPRNPTNSFMYYFKQVDAATGRLGRESFYIGFSPAGSFGSEITPPQNSSKRWNARKVPAGQYVLHTLMKQTQIATSFNREVGCYSQPAPIFEFKKGSVNIVDARGENPFAPPQSENLQAEATELLKGYPAVTSELTIAAPIGFGKLEPKSNFMGVPNCLPGNTVEVQTK